ncbi:MAG TPA: hypothetical protein VHN17_11385 [Steroidobacteraceae bacterium]|jgi:hypothetical protein|nr:hypothetical protein [Steroidobacteraceae bacterium]
MPQDAPAAAPGAVAAGRVHPMGVARRTILRMQQLYSYLAGLAAIGVTAGGVGGQYYQGSAYAADDGRLLYREAHWLYADNGVEHRLVVYSCPDGAPFVRKRVDTAPGAATPDVDLFDGRGGYREGVRTRDGRREVFAQANARAPEHSAQLPLPSPPNAVIDAGFDAFVREHWATLSASGVSPVLFLVPSELRYLDFSARVLRDSRVDGADMRWFRLSLASWYGFALPHIDVAYDLQTHELREYSGLSNIRDGDGRNVRVSIRFAPSERRQDVAAAEVERAAAMPLTGRCMLR